MSPKWAIVSPYYAHFDYFCLFIFFSQYGAAVFSLLSFLNLCLRYIKMSQIHASISHISPNPAWTRSYYICWWLRWNLAWTRASQPLRLPADVFVPASNRLFCVALTSCSHHGTHSLCLHPSILVACAKYFLNLRKDPVSLHANWFSAMLRDLRHLATEYRYAFLSDAAEPRRCPEPNKRKASYFRVL